MDPVRHKIYGALYAPSFNPPTIEIVQTGGTWVAKYSGTASEETRSEVRNLIAALNKHGHAL